MNKTLGQIAYESVGMLGTISPAWNQIGSQKVTWEVIAAAVAAAVKEEDARICGQFQDGGPFADMIRASIKEVKS